MLLPHTHIFYIFLFFAFPSATKLGWFDTHLVTLHKIYAVDEFGNETKLDASFFAPYDVVFAQNRFQKMVDNKTICDIYGSINEEKQARSLYDLKNNDEIKKYINENGTNKFNSTNFIKMQQFIAKFVNNKSNSSDYFPISSPMHIWQGDNQKKLQLKPSKIVFRYFEINTYNYPILDTIHTNQWHVDIMKY